MRGTNLKSDHGDRHRTMSADQWREYCQSVGAAAEQLRHIALQAECAATVAAASNDPLRAMAREIGLGSSTGGASAQTYCTMMLGPFAALEELRRQILN